jgi:DNA-directed RNA polymerase
MGQEIVYDSDDWEFQEDDLLTPIISTILVPADFFKQSIKDRQVNSRIAQNHLAPEIHKDIEESEITAYINGEKIKITHKNLHNSNNMGWNQVEQMFTQQIEDLFELLELEKSSGKTGEGVRIYQTDSAPSKPWRFH